MRFTNKTNRNSKSEINLLTIYGFGLFAINIYFFLCGARLFGLGMSYFGFLSSKGYLVEAEFVVALIAKECHLIQY